MRSPVPLELYLAGFIPLGGGRLIFFGLQWMGSGFLTDFEPNFDEETGNGLTIYLRTKTGIAFSHAREIKKYTTIDDIIAEHGPRVPDHLQSQKDFRAAVILLVSEDYPATREILESVSDDALWFSHAGEYESGESVMAGALELLRGNRRQRYDHHGRSVSFSKQRSGAKRLVPQVRSERPHRPSWILENDREDLGRTSRPIPAEEGQLPLKRNRSWGAASTVSAGRFKLLTSRGVSSANRRWETHNRHSDRPQRS